MKLQFSLATLLVCMTVLAVVAAVWMKVPVEDIEVSYVQNPFSLPARDIHKVQHTKNNKWEVKTGIKRSPNVAGASQPIGVVVAPGTRRHVRRAVGRPPPEIPPPH